MIQPSLPENFEDLDKTEQSREKELYYDRLAHYHYVKNTGECNGLHYAAFTKPLPLLRHRLFDFASAMWEGEILALKVALIEAAENWETLTERGTVVFDSEDARETMKQDGVQKGADEVLKKCLNIIGCGSAMAASKKLKEKVLAGADLEEERAEIAAHWPFDDMTEEKYL